MLPKCPLNHEAFDSNIRQDLGGWCQIAAIDLEESLPKTIKDHPWIGRLVTFPQFVDYGYKDGKILNCIVHPLGKLMFDIEYATPVPPIHGYSGHYRVALVNKLDYYQSIVRMFGDEIQELSDA